MNGQVWGSEMNNDKYHRNMGANRVAVLGAIMYVAMGTVAAYGQQTAATITSDVGHSTKEWLSIQRDNRAAAPTQPMLGDVATLTYQRYLDSFKNKIPESMSSQMGSAGGMSGSGQSAQ